MAAFQVRVERLFQQWHPENFRIDSRRHDHADPAHARLAGVRAGHLDLVAMLGGHRGTGTQGECTASRDTHVDLPLQHHADGKPGALLRGSHIGEPVMHVRGDQAHATAHELFVDLAATGPLVLAQVFRISAVIEAMALAETAVIGKGEISGHRSALGKENGASVHARPSRDIALFSLLLPPR